jgi:hypothetical protein
MLFYLCRDLYVSQPWHGLINRVLSLISLFGLLCENDIFEVILILILEIIIQ